jgi:hypothetical protein
MGVGREEGEVREGRGKGGVLVRKMVGEAGGEVGVETGG